MYKLIFEKQAEKFFKKLDKKEQIQIAKKIDELSINPKLGKPLVEKLAGLWSLRIGNYRAIYIIKNEELVVLILKLGHRKNVYDF